MPWRLTLLCRYIESLPGQFIWIGLCSSSPIISREITLLNMGLGNDEDIQEVHQDILDKLEARRLEFLEEYDQRDD